MGTDRCPTKKDESARKENARLAPLPTGAGIEWVKTIKNVITVCAATTTQMDTKNSTLQDAYTRTFAQEAATVVGRSQG